MQDNIMQFPAHPFFRLAQANMDRLTRFSSSSAMTTQATANFNQLLQQGAESAMQLMKSGAYTELMEGLVKDYTEFLTDCSRSTLALMSQGQSALQQQASEVQEGAAEIADVADVRARRSRHAA